jgi:hypothetical protein
MLYASPFSCNEGKPDDQPIWRRKAHLDSFNMGRASRKIGPVHK